MPVRASALLRIYVTVCIGTVGKLIVNRCRYRQQPCSMSFQYASQHLRRYDVSGKCNHDHDGMQKRGQSVPHPHPHTPPRLSH